MPPSINKAYVSIGRGRRKLSPEGKLFKRVFKDLIIPFLAVDEGVISLQKEEVPLKLEIRLYFKGVLNKGYPKKAKMRYKRIDLSNRLKLLEDALFESLGTDDSHVFELSMSKHLRPPDVEEDFCEIILCRSRILDGDNL